MTILALLAGAAIAHEFAFTADGPLQSLNLVGTFNNWDKSACPMKVDADGRTWRVKVDLAAGSYQYKFVANGDKWMTDPGARTVDDGNGNTNSLLILLPPSYSASAHINDGVITNSALAHSPKLPDLNYDLGNLQVTISVRPNDVASVWAESGGKRYPAQPMGGDEVTERMRADIPWDRTSPVSYRFILQDGNLTESFGKDGLAKGTSAQPFRVDPKTFRPFLVPDWVQRSVIYQIFPDRFADGDTSNDPDKTEPWGGKPTWYNFFGGDLAGVDQHLAWLQNLGVDAIYFNPIFKSPVNHGYETTDYREVEPRLGGNAAFEHLASDLHSRGMKVVLDGVFNHTATNFGPFADILKNQASSRYASWYFVHKYPVKVQDKPDYEAWWGFPSLPKLNDDNPEVQDYLLGTLKFWNEKAHVDGWRLDAANEVSPAFWRRFRPELKAINPKAWIVGEIWGDGNPWLDGDQFDATMDYLFRNVAIRSIAQGQGTASEVTGSLMNLYSLYPPQVSRNEMLILGTHDTPRFLTECGGDIGKAKLGALLQMTWVGSPCIYYGDEIGMEGGKDPDNRRCMEWGRANADNSLFSFYTKLVKARRSSEALQVGEPVPVSGPGQGNLVAYGRVATRGAALVVLNRSKTAETEEFTLPARLHSALPSTLVDALGGGSLSVPASGRLRLTVPTESGAIYLPMPATMKSR